MTNTQPSEAARKKKVRYRWSRGREAIPETRPTEGESKQVAIIGAGAAGISAAKYALEAGLEVTVCEMGSHIGGMWVYGNDNRRNSAYKTLSINSDKGITAFSDLPFPEGTQIYPHHTEMAAYLNEYADRFDVRRHVLFNTEVRDVRPQPVDNGQPAWEVEVADGSVRTFDAIIVATGHLSEPLHPDLSGTFGGEYLHGNEYDDPTAFGGKRLCVLGMGNTAVDIACDSCVTAARTVLVARHGVLVVPKLLFGVPVTRFTNIVRRRWIPGVVAVKVTRLITRIAHGRMEQWGIKEPDRLVHPTTSATLISHLAYRRIEIKPGIEDVSGRKITFTDGTSEEFDTLIAATGYRVTLPFISPDIVPVRDNRLELYRRVVPVDWPGLYLVGFVNSSSSSLNAIFEAQSKWVAHVITGDISLPSRDEMVRDIRETDQYLAAKYRQTPRHTLEVEGVRYIPELDREARRAARRSREGVKT